MQATIEDMVRDIFDNMEIILFAWGILQVKMTKEKKIYICMVLIFLLSEVVYMLCPDKNVGYGLGKILGQMIAVLIIFQGKWGERFVKYWFDLFYVDMIHFPAKVVVDVCFLPLQEERAVLFIKENLISILSIILIILCSRQIKKRDEWISWIRSIPVYYYYLGIICSFCTIFIGAFVEYARVGQNKTIQIMLEIMRLVISTFLYLLGIGFAFVNLWRMQYKRESALKDDYLKISKRYYEKLASHMDEVRSMKHDMRAHLNLLETFIREKRWEQAQDYLQEIKAQQKWNREQIIDVGHELVSAVFTDCIQRNSDIKFVCEGILPEHLAISDFDLCTIFSNLISNSVESCERIEGQEKWVHMQVKVFHNNLLIALENPVKEEITVEKLGQFTSKKDKADHGFGIMNVKKTVEKYGGEIDFFTDNGKFQVKMVFYDVIN